MPTCYASDLGISPATAVTWLQGGPWGLFPAVPDCIPSMSPSWPLGMAAVPGKLCPGNPPLALWTPPRGEGDPPAVGEPMLRDF